MRHIECRALAADAYPAGLHLACDLWAATYNSSSGPLSVTAIEQFWDGVKLVGAVPQPFSAIERVWSYLTLRVATARQRPFAIEINYAMEETVLLSVNLSRRRFEGRRRHRQLLEEIASALEAVLDELDGRGPVSRVSV